MYFKIAIISFLISICYVMSSKIANYSQYITNYEECGLSRNSLLMNTQCFENRYDFNPPLRGGRDALKGEAPWLVQVYHPATKVWFITIAETSCGGSLLSNEWVLTAAHCLEYEGAKNYWVYTDLEAKGGPNYYEVSKKIQHPRSKDHNWIKYDIGLLKLKTKLSLDSTNDYKSRATMCLPSKNFTLYTKHLARTAGFGVSESHLQIATYSVVKYKEYFSMRILSIFGGSICFGDSGSPIWMYENGRAFVIGVHSHGVGMIECTQEIMSPFVPDHIDWILETMLNN